MPEIMTYCQRSTMNTEGQLKFKEIGENVN